MSLCIAVCNIRAQDISRSTGVWDTTPGRHGLKEGTPPGYLSGWECQSGQRAEPGRDKESYNVAREGFSDPGAATIAKVHIKVKAIETNGKHKPQRDLKETDLCFMVLILVKSENKKASIAVLTKLDQPR